MKVSANDDYTPYQFDAILSDIKDSLPNGAALRSLLNLHAPKLVKEIERLRVLSAEYFNALKTLEAACDARASARPQSVYDAELQAGMDGVLSGVDYARSRAREALRLAQI